MPNWKRIFIGDTFTRAPLDYYRDLFLVWPFLCVSLGAVWTLLTSANHLLSLKLGVCAALILLLSKEKLVLILAASVYVAIKTAFGLMLIHTWPVVALLLISGGTVLVIVRFAIANKWRPKYARPRKRSVLDLAVCVLGIGVMMAIGLWIKS